MSTVYFMSYILFFRQRPNSWADLAENFCQELATLEKASTNPKHIHGEARFFIPTPTYVTSCIRLCKFC
jgi:hypothetical protein